MKPASIRIVATAWLALCLTLAPGAGAGEPVAVIMDTDMLTDCDDAGALAMLHTLADRGEVRILGIVLDGQDRHGKHGAVVSAINRYCGRPDLPIGACKRPAGSSPQKASSYSRAVWDEWPHDGLLDAQRPDAVAVYRELLAAAPDRSVTIIAIGFLTTIEDLLRSPGDARDARSGVDLVRAKVKSLVAMGGQYPSGSEHNFNYAKATGATRHVVATWPDAEVPVVFSGYSIGGDIITGKAYRQAPPSPMRRCYELAYDSLNKGRPSWDQTAVLYAARGHEHRDAAGATQRYWTLVDQGWNDIAEDGSNFWRTDRDRNQAYLVEALPDAQLAALIDELMVR